MSTIEHTVCDGKYTIIFDENTGKLEALRYGLPWRSLDGDGMVLAMLQEIDNLKNIIGDTVITTDKHSDYIHS